MISTLPTSELWKKHLLPTPTCSLDAIASCLGAPGGVGPTEEEAILMLNEALSGEMNERLFNPYHLTFFRDTFVIKYMISVIKCLLRRLYAKDVYRHHLVGHKFG